eukprot:TRINITY_DN2332_c0_g1_i1.p1 TRINITY_DN2332_c0_g1~~TRINITY_DN2332_c0_g1_i1.p1  ORF type:complete len:158 (+),score=26.06 TRINITY_DN2332_c0_g1_i1:64-537(+)
MCIRDSVPFIGVYLNHIVMAMEKFKAVEETSYFPSPSSSFASDSQITAVTCHCSLSPGLKSRKSGKSISDDDFSVTNGKAITSVAACPTCGVTLLKERKWIHVEKYREVVEVLRDVQHFKRSVYKFPKNPQIFNFIRNLPIIDEEILYSISSPQIVH